MRRVLKGMAYYKQELSTICEPKLLRLPWNC